MSLKDRLAPRSTGAVAELERRVAELEAEVQECRNVNLRVAELTDLVTQLLGGHIRLHTAEGEGCRVEVVLPLRAADRGA